MPLADHNFRISNTKHQILHSKSQMNVDKFFSRFEELGEFRDTEYTRTNIKDMDLQLKTITSNGKLTEDDWEYETLSKILSDQKEYLAKPDKTFEDMLNHFSSVKGFNDIMSSFDGESDDS